MVREDEIRAAKRAAEWPNTTDSRLIFIGRIRTPWTSRMVTHCRKANITANAIQSH